MPARSCRDVLSPAGFRNTTKRDDAKRGDDLDREREKKTERERARFEERKRKVRDRPTFLYLFFNAGINGDIFKALFKKQPQKGALQKYLCREKKQDVHQPLKTTTTTEEEEEEEEEENDRENDAREGM